MRFMHWERWYMEVWDQYGLNHVEGFKTKLAAHRAAAWFATDIGEHLTIFIIPPQEQ